MVLALSAGAVPAVAPHPVPSSEAASAVAARAAAAEALGALSVRVRAVASDVAEQVAVHRELAQTDWHGPAAAAFAGALDDQVALLRWTVEALERLADEAGRRAGEADGASVLQTGGAW